MSLVPSENRTTEMLIEVLVGTQKDLANEVKLLTNIVNSIQVVIGKQNIELKQLRETLALLNDMKDKIHDVSISITAQSGNNETIRNMISNNSTLINNQAVWTREIALRQQELEKDVSERKGIERIINTGVSALIAGLVAFMFTKLGIGS